MLAKSLSKTTFFIKTLNSVYFICSHVSRGEASSNVLVFNILLARFVALYRSNGMPLSNLCSVTVKSVMKCCPCISPCNTLLIGAMNTAFAINFDLAKWTIDYPYDCHSNYTEQIRLHAAPFCFVSVVYLRSVRIEWITVYLYISSHLSDKNRCAAVDLCLLHFSYVTNLILKCDVNRKITYFSYNKSKSLSVWIWVIYLIIMYLLDRTI